MRRWLHCVSALGALCWAREASAAEVYNEALNGDLSNNRAAPTVIALAPGLNTITATSVGPSGTGDLEYWSVTVPPGKHLARLRLVSFSSPGGSNLAFLAVQSGSAFTEPPIGTTVGNLLGYTHFGPGNGTVGADILDNLGSSAGADGFLGPLPAGTYTFWSQETGASTPTTYTFELALDPVPAVPVPALAAVALAGALGLLGALRRKRDRGESTT